ncbi:MAG: hypothetical protein ACJ72Z_06335 [Pyrinomonadaceae bacterium]
MKLNKFKSFFFAVLLIPGLIFVGEGISSNNGSMTAGAQTVTVRRTSRNIGHAAYRGGRWVVRKTWNGTKWVYRKTWYPTKRFGKATWRGTKKVGRTVKRAIT